MEKNEWPILLVIIAVMVIALLSLSINPTRANTSEGMSNAASTSLQTTINNMHTVSNIGMMVH